MSAARPATGAPTRARARAAACALAVVLACAWGCDEPDADAGAGAPASAAAEIAVIRVRGQGEIRFALLPDVAPNHVEAFRRLAQSGFYDGTTFHRVIPGFLIHGGNPNTRDDDPSNDGWGGPGFKLPPEFSDLPHRSGTVSMARGAALDSAGSQFFIILGDHPDFREMMDGKYTVFGQVISGLDVARRIARVPANEELHAPLERVEVESIRILPAAEGEGP